MLGECDEQNEMLRHNWRVEKWRRGKFWRSRNSLQKISVATITAAGVLVMFYVLRPNVFGHLSPVGGTSCIMLVKNVEMKWKLLLHRSPVPIRFRFLIFSHFFYVCVYTRVRTPKNILCCPTFHFSLFYTVYKKVERFGHALPRPHRPQLKKKWSVWYRFILFI